LLRPETLNPVEEHNGKTLEDMGIGNDFLNRTPTAQKIITTIDKWDCIKLESFCTAKDYCIYVHQGY
jgi:hypothetical protein